MKKFIAKFAAPGTNAHRAGIRRADASLLVLWARVQVQMKSTCKQCGAPKLDTEVELCTGCTSLRLKPDALSKRNEAMGKPFVDMKDMAEDERITVIARQCQANRGKSYAVMVDCGPAYVGKAARYIRKVRALLPTVEAIRTPGAMGIRNDEVETIVFRLL